MPLLDELGLECPLDVPGGRNLELPAVRLDGFAGFAVAGVSRAMALGRVLLLPEMGGHLLFQSSLDESRSQLFDQATFIE